MPYSSLKVLQNAATATGDGTVFRGNEFGNVAFQVAGVTTATITWECSVTGANYVGLLAAPPSTGTGALTATANGVYRAQAYPYMRARISAYTSGTITVTAQGLP